MLEPKRSKHRKMQKGRRRGRSKGATKLDFGEYGLRALESGWLTARVRTKRQLAALRKLLQQSHSLHGVGAGSDPGPRQEGDDATARIDRVLREAADEGWAPRSDW